MADIETSKVDGCGVITINRPEANNAAGGDFFPGILQAVREFETDPSVHAIITTSSQGAWCAGADHSILEFGPAGDADRSFWDGLMHGRDELLSGSVARRAFDELGVGTWVVEFLRCQKPLIAAIEGAAAGGGLGFALLHDYRIASPRALFKSAFIGIGVGPDLGTSYFLSRVVGPGRAAEILLRNRRVTAEQAHEWGLVDDLVGEGAALEAALAMGRDIAVLPPLAVRATVRALRKSMDNSLLDQLALEWDTQRAAFRTQDAAAALQAFRTRGTASYVGR
ncbi:enoyl-CoA hydratase/isomerase family protein [Nocardioides daejeonensis]|uniref:enoyl-CoA hydratase/isomerase family protein n=1 Tax=Nocardioides daejeonensis TaxID=1046556 RepID=UPI000D74E17D|nr:enoyl-CoA hydratase/isomerase family protein [Nocardioides daejeonensis]